MVEDDLFKVLEMELREGDLNEIKAGSGLYPPCALYKSIRNSDVCWVAEDEHKTILAVFGVCVYPDVGVPWYLGTKKATSKPRLFLELSLEVVDKMLSIHPILVNVVDSRNNKAIKWLRLLGFTIYPTQAITMYDKEVLFYPFRKEIPCVV